MDMQDNIRYIHIDRIHPNLRLCYPDETIECVCNSIRSECHCAPITVFFDGEHFRIIDGEKRWRACKKMELGYIEAVIVESYYSF